MGDEYTRHWTGKLLLTPGVRWHCDQAKCWWLADIVASYQGYKKVRSCEFQVWRLRVAADKSAVVTMDEGSDATAVVVRQELEFTDYPENECEWFVVLTPGQPGVLMTPVEY